MIEPFIFCNVRELICIAVCRPFCIQRAAVLHVMCYKNVRALGRCPAFKGITEADSLWQIAVDVARLIEKHVAWCAALTCIECDIGIFFIGLRRVVAVKEDNRFLNTSFCKTVLHLAACMTPDAEGIDYFIS